MGLEINREAVEREVDSDDKDGGIDVAAWHSFEDKKPGIATYLVQCQRRSHTSVNRPTSCPMWAAWVRFGLPPGIALSIPFSIPPDAKVRDKILYRVNLLLDRLRLCQLLQGRDIAQFDEYEFMKTWIEDEIEKIRGATTLTKPRLPKPRKSAGHS